MAHFKRKLVKGIWYISIYEGRNKFLKHLGREDSFTPEKLMFLKRKYSGRVKEDEIRNNNQV